MAPQVAQTAPIDVALKIGSASESVSVTAVSEALRKTERAETETPAQ